MGAGGTVLRAKKTRQDKLKINSASAEGQLMGSEEMKGGGNLSRAQPKGGVVSRYGQDTRGRVKPTAASFPHKNNTIKARHATNQNGSLRRFA